MTCTACPADPHIAIGTRFGPEGDLRSTIYWDSNDAPRNAVRYCSKHGRETIIDLARTFAPVEADR
jgi:hypothetical protein